MIWWDLCVVAASGPVEEDELYEDYLAETNLIYKVEDGQLNIVEEFSGQIPRYDMLEDNQVRSREVNYHS